MWFYPFMTLRMLVKEYFSWTISSTTKPPRWCKWWREWQDRSHSQPSKSSLHLLLESLQQCWLLQRTGRAFHPSGDTSSSTYVSWNLGQAWQKMPSPAWVVSTNEMTIFDIIWSSAVGFKFTSKPEEFQEPGQRCQCLCDCIQSHGAHQREVSQLPQQRDQSWTPWVGWLCGGSTTRDPIVCSILQWSHQLEAERPTRIWQALHGSASACIGEKWK